MAVAPQHWLSLARLVAGAAAWLSLSRPDRSAVVLPLVLLACLLDFSDGRLARARGSEGPVGRVLDNICDFAFLAMFFHASAGVGLWSDPLTGVVAQWWQRANGIPLLGLSLSFGSYAVRALVCAARAWPMLPSPAGRAAGILNYALALLGAASVSLDRTWPPSVVVEGVMIVVASVNVTAFAQNGFLLMRQVTRART